MRKSWRSPNFHFASLKDLNLGQILDSSNSRRYHWVLKLLVATSKSDVKNSVRFFSIYVLFLIYYILNKIVRLFSREKTLLNVTHDRKGISTFPYIALKSLWLLQRYVCFSLKRYLLLNLELSKVKTGQILYIFCLGNKLIREYFGSKF